MENDSDGLWLNSHSRSLTLFPPTWTISTIKFSVWGTSTGIADAMLEGPAEMGTVHYLIAVFYFARKISSFFCHGGGYREGAGGALHNNNIFLYCRRGVKTGTGGR